jgi:hypothetical protein
MGTILEDRMVTPENDALVTWLAWRSQEQNHLSNLLKN